MNKLFTYISTFVVLPTYKERACGERKAVSTIHQLSRILPVLLVLVLCGCDDTPPEVTQKYKVTFQANGGTPAPSDQEVVQGKTAQRPDSITRTGFTFTGWYSDAALSKPYAFSTPVTADLTLYAGWQEDTPTYTVTFQANGGTPVPSDQEVVQGTTAQRPDSIKRAGFTFTGWYSDAALSKPYDFSTLVKADLTLYAKWEPIETLENVYSVVEGGYWVFDVEIPWTPTQNVILNGSFASDNIINYVNDGDYQPQFDYRTQTDGTWTTGNSERTITIPSGKRSVYVRVKTIDDASREVVWERMSIVFTPSASTPPPTAYRDFTLRLSVAVRDNDVTDDERQIVREAAVGDDDQSNLMYFEVSSNEVTLVGVIDSVTNMREKRIIDGDYTNLVRAVKQLNATAPIDFNLRRFFIYFHQPSTWSLVGGYVYGDYTVEKDSNEQVILIDGKPIIFPESWNLSMNASIAFWSTQNAWKRQAFNEDGVFGHALIHEFGHILTLKRGQADYFHPLYPSASCPRNGGLYVHSQEPARRLCALDNSYLKWILTNFYQDVNTLPSTKAGLKGQAYVSNYARADYREDLAESFAAYVTASDGLLTDLAANDNNAYQQKVTGFGAFDEAREFRGRIRGNTDIRAALPGVLSNKPPLNANTGGVSSLTLHHNGGHKACVLAPNIVLD